MVVIFIKEANHKGGDFEAVRGPSSQEGKAFFVIGVALVLPNWQN